MSSASRPKSTIGIVNKKLGQFVQLTAELTGKATRSDVDDEFKSIQTTFERKRVYVEHASSNVRAMLASAHVKSTERNLTHFSVVGQDMISAGSDLSEDSNLGAALVKCGEALEKAADCTMDWETRIRDGYLNPLLSLQDNEIREMQHQKRKLENRRLDYDAKRNNFEKSKKPDVEAEMNAAKAKYNETIQTMREMMTTITTNEDAEIDQLAEFVESMRSYFESGYAIFNNLSQTLKDPSIRGTRVARAQARKESQTNLSNGGNGANGGGGGDQDEENGDGETETPTTPAAAQTTVGELDDFNPFLDDSSSRAGVTSSSSSGSTKIAKPPKPAKPENESKGLSSVLNRATSNATSLMDKLTKGSNSKKDEKPVINIVSAEPMGAPAKPPKDTTKESTVATGTLVDVPSSTTSTATTSQTLSGSPSGSLLDSPVPKPRMKPAPTESSQRFQALFDFIPDQDDELPFKKGDIITLLKKVDDGWWIGEFNGRRGLMPANFLGPIHQQ